MLYCVLEYYTNLCFEIFYYVDFYSLFESNPAGISRGRFNIDQSDRFSSGRASHHSKKKGAQESPDYSSLMERLHKTDSLLDFGEVRVQDYGTAMPSSVSDSDFFARRKLQVGEMAPKRRVKGTVRLQRLGSLLSTQLNDEEDETKEDRVEQLLEKLQEANFVASGKKGFANQKQFVCA